MEVKKGFEAIETDYDIKKIYEKMEKDLIESMKRTLGSHKQDEKVKGFDWPQWQTLKLKQLQNYRNKNEEKFKGYQEQIDAYVYKKIKEQFREGARRTNKDAINAGKIKEEDSQLGGSFFGINDRKINALEDSVVNNLKDATRATLRQANDVYRSTVYKASQMASHGAKTINQAIDMATRDFLSRGFKTIEYKDGSLHSTADYADMAVRTATKRANLMGEGEMRKKLGNPLVYISKHGGACDKCTPWEGRVYIDNVWSGGKEEDGKYPLLSIAIEGGLFHPRCQHGSSTYYEGINDEPEEVIQAKHNHNKNDKYTQYLQQRQKQYERLALGSLSPENIEKYQNKVNELQNQIESSKIELSEEEQYAINQYISSESYKINEVLRNDSELTKQQEEMIRNLDKVLDKMPTYKGDTTRSLKFDENELKIFLKQHFIGNTVKYKSYTSSTVGSRYNELSNIELHIKSKSGRDVRKFNSQEQEILFERNTTFRIINKEKIKSVYHIYMEEINEQSII